MKALFVSLLAALSWFQNPSPLPAGEADATHVETIVGIRHGEKPEGNSLGQLTCRGLNRALALPKVLTAKYGRPNFIFAPDPAMTTQPPDSYVRPLMTIEPTAIWLTMPVDAQIGAHDIQLLQQVMTGPAYEDSLIFVAWEHGQLDRFARNLVETYGGNPSIVPPWPSSDYDSIFVIRLTRRGGRTSVSFRHDQENLDSHLRDNCPGE